MDHMIHTCMKLKSCDTHIISVKYDFHEIYYCISGYVHKNKILRKCLEIGCIYLCDKKV